MYSIVRARDFGLIIDAQIDGKDESSVQPYLEALVKEMDEEEINSEYGRYKVLEVISSDEDKLTLGRVPEFGDYISLKKSCTEIVLEQENMSEPDIDKAGQLEKEFDTLHERAPYKIHGSFYDEIKDGSWRAELIEDRDFETPEYVNSLEKAEIWLLENHPDYYMGCSIHQECKSGDFLCTAIPCVEYEKGLYETWNGRREYAESHLKELLERVGMEEKGHALGPVEHDEYGHWVGVSMDKEMMRDKHMEDKIPGKESPEKALERNTTQKDTVDKDFVIIWQRSDKAFVDLSHYRERGLEPQRSDFTPVYVGPKMASLDDVYSNFQNDSRTPDGYNARAVSVGDIITRNDNGKDRSYIVEPTGFKEVKDFTKDMYLVNGMIHDKQRMTPAEIEKFEDRYGVDIDGSKTIGSDGRAADALDRDSDGNGYADRYDEPER